MQYMQIDWNLVHVKMSTQFVAIYLVERNGSGVELRTLNYKRTGVQILCCCVKTLGNFISLYIAPVHLAA